ncbi:MAG TPA: LLM class flavin-dependent oxidoreductase [Dehalococcoidia bacterium]|nr:LLM class flavin-dependent oxidoreductase [Chloroflexota bacterium]HCE77083.1 LLM class flavin-dependent oxidoreductase [Dehalococcoidia bacterium]|tara:strand:- start:6929 stop:8293 length:1365 start_codon:yes stop_codon:yes gene_type:complete
MSGDKNNKMILGAFMQAANCSNYAASWRHPETMTDFLTPEYFQRIARTLEDGKFHFAFIDDRLAMPGIYRDSIEDSLIHGVRVVKFDLIPIVMAMAMSTENLGVGATYSTTYHGPFHIARLFATLDHMTGGRVGWNVVTSLNDEEAQNFGLENHLKHDQRYDQADEVMEIIEGLWDTWADDALIANKEEGIFADPDKVRRLEYTGSYVKSRGPLTVPRPPQGHPVVMQAGQSSRGRDFAAKWGEVIFAVFKTIEEGKRIGEDIRERAAKYGRNPQDIKIVTAAYAIPGTTTESATEKMKFIESLATTTDKLTLLSELLNFDFGAYDMNHQLTPEQLNSISGSRGMAEQFMKEGKEPTISEFIDASNRGTIHELPVFCGTPNNIAIEMTEWFTEGGCDGFMLAATHVPGAYEDFVRMVIPKLQEMGTVQSEYTGQTMREGLGLERPTSQYFGRPQ